MPLCQHGAGPYRGDASNAIDIENIQVWYVRWQWNQEVWPQWSLENLCDRCLAKPDYVQILVSIRAIKGSAIYHYLHHYDGGSPLGWLHNTLLKLGIGNIDRESWRVVDAEVEKDTKIIRRIREIIDKINGEEFRNKTS